MPNIHALHAVYGDDFNPQRFLDAEGKKDLYVIPFGKGRRSCPGQMLGMLMAVNYVKEFIIKHPTAFVVNSLDEHIRFNNISRSKLVIGIANDAGKVSAKSRQSPSTTKCPFTQQELEVETT